MIEDRGILVLLPQRRGGGVFLPHAAPGVGRPRSGGRFHEPTCKSHQIACRIRGFEKELFTTGLASEFLKMLPKITEHASFSFRHLKGDSRDEMIQEVVTNALKAFVRLVEQGRSEAATWSSLARYAVRQVRTDDKSVAAQTSAMCLPAIAKNAKG